MATSEEEYGSNYKAHLLEQYKLYVEMADRLSSRRQSANSFFLSVNTAIIALVGYLNFGSKASSEFYWLVSLSGIVLCFMWYRLIRSYKDLNSAKFKVIHEIEAQLPLAPYDMEWDKVGRGKNSRLYLPFTRVEVLIPWVFLVLHVFVFLKAVSFLSFLAQELAAK
ncbi:hypothetical protein IPdc08_00034 [archaeon]|nr:hypothetical protein IPdc08_00034 [archaeon]